VPARKPRGRSNPNLAKPHAAGAKVAILQLAIHQTFGTLAFEQPEYSSIYQNIARMCFDTTEELFVEMLQQTPVNTSNSRVFGNALIEQLGTFMYHGYNLVLYSHLAVEMYTIERLMWIHGMGQTQQLDWSSVDVTDRLRRDLPNLLGCPRLPDEVMAAFGKIRIVRDNIMHPKPSSILCGNENWDAVPMAWLLSERRQTCIPTMDAIINHFEPYYEQFKQQHDHEATVTVERGIEYLHNAKRQVE
jgi:hypothetical protein